MKKLVLAAVAVVAATMSIAGSANAYDRNGDDGEWRRRPHEEQRDGDWRGRDRDRDRPGFDDRRGDDRHWREDRPRDHHRRDGWRHDGWRYNGWNGGYWGPRVIIRPGYYEPVCFIKKVRRYDAWGYPYVKRVRICR